MSPRPSPILLVVSRSPRAALAPGRSEARRLGLPLAASLLLFALAGCASVTPAKSLPESTRNRTAVAESTGAAESDAGDASAREPEPEESSALPTPALPEPRVMIVKASAYNSRRGQTDSTPNIGAWGDRLEPGMKAIAVSKDLFELGLRRGQKVTIVGLEGEYVVLDRMPARWQQKIDIYMGTDVRAAFRWGVRDVEIQWIPEEETALEVDAEAGVESAAE